MNVFYSLIASLILSLCSSSVLAINNDVQDLERLLKQLVSEQRESNNLVGLGAVVIQNGKVIGPSVSGERKKGSQVLLTDNDKWHIGSITKSFTATMIARLVEKGELSWNTTIKEVFSEVDGLNPGWNSVTLEHLLTHTSGARRDIPFFDNFKKPADGLERMMAREKVVIKILKKKPKITPGDAFIYSNAGYIIAGVMAEKKTGMPWEKLMRQEVFAPLQLQSAGFGSPQDGEDKLSQPWGHWNKNWLSTMLAMKASNIGVKAGTLSDITPILGPAGTIHVSLKDLALYANEHLQGEQDRGSLFKTETFHRLHHPSKNNYAYGWYTDPQQKLGWGTVYRHTGSNDRWEASLVILPDINTAIAVTSNESYDITIQSVQEIINQLVQPLTESYNQSIQLTAKVSSH